jgi:hypothetical protein
MLEQGPFPSDLITRAVNAPPPRLRVVGTTHPNVASCLVCSVNDCFPFAVSHGPRGLHINNSSQSHGTGLVRTLAADSPPRPVVRPVAISGDHDAAGKDKRKDNGAQSFRYHGEFFLLTVHRPQRSTRLTRARRTRASYSHRSRASRPALSLACIATSNSPRRSGRTDWTSTRR